MRPEDVLHWLRATPFAPFRIRMKDEHTCDVRHPELIGLMRRSFIFFTPSLEEGVYDQAQMFGLVLIECIEPLERAASNVGT